MVKCAECGFLALQDRRMFGLVEAIEYTRKTGQIIIELPGGPNYDRWPHCFKRMLDFKAMMPKGSHGPSQTDVLQAIHTEIDCSEFLEWIPNRSPQDHQDMIEGNARHSESMTVQKIILALTFIGAVAAIVGAVVGIITLIRMR